MRRTHCNACGYDDLRVFLDLGHSPVADAYTAGPWDSGPGYPLQVAVCTGCHLAQLLEVVDQKTLFGTGYSFYSSASPPLSAYHEDYARNVIWEHGGDVALGLTVEIGCNDGDLLRHFHRAFPGGKVIGVDPSGGPVEKARERGLDVVNEPFGELIAQDLVFRFGRAKLIVANHVLAHVESVADVLHGMSLLLADDGVAYVEVQYLPDLLTNNAFDLVYHEHRNFFSLTSLTTAARRWGLVPLEAQLTDRQGGSLRVKLTHAKNVDRTATDISVRDLLYREKWLQSTDAYGGVQGRADRIRDRLQNVITDERTEGGRSVAVYGAPAKATTLLNFCNLDTDLLDFVVDSTEAKQGRFVPGTGLKIVAPSDPCVAEISTFLVTSWNYAQTIVRNHEAQHGQRRWILPIPAPVIL